MLNMMKPNRPSNDNPDVIHDYLPNGDHLWNYCHRRRSQPVQSPWKRPEPTPPRYGKANQIALGVAWASIIFILGAIGYALLW